MKVLVLVVTYNARHHIVSVLEKLRPQLGAGSSVSALVLDDASADETARLCTEWSRQNNVPLVVERNPINLGYGGNQKKGYRYAIANGYDAVALLHGDGQYPPDQIGALLDPIVNGTADAVIGSRMRNKRWALSGGMPLYKFVGNVVLTSFQNFVLGTHLSEYHSGFRAYRIAALRRIPFEANSDYFTFDTDILIQLKDNRFTIAEISIHANYGDEVCYVNNIRYALDVVRSTLRSRLQRIPLFYDKRFDYKGMAGK
jgi:glycosyltransferase involved in cell wall biosynthesis